MAFEKRHLPRGLWSSSFALLFLSHSHLSWAARAATPYYRYPGAVHVHTRYSDGSGNYPEVVRAAEAAGLKYVIFTDHNTLQPRKEGHERYWNSTLVLVSAEISTEDGHIVALDLPDGFDLSPAPAQTVLDRIRNAGGMPLLAHPMAKSWSWKDWSVRGYAGMEVVNLAALVDDDLRGAMHVQAPGRSLREVQSLVRRYVTNPGAVMRQWTDNTALSERGQWDRLLGEGRQVVGIASVDAHANVKAGNRQFKIPTYQQAFRAVQTYAVTLQPLQGALDRDRKLIYDAYRNGRLYMAYTSVARAPGFEFTVEEAGRRAVLGQPFSLQKEARFAVHAPDHPRPYIRLLRNGVEVASEEGKTLEWKTTVPGVYRTEVYVVEGAKIRPSIRLRKGLKVDLKDALKKRKRTLRPWIFSNPIYLKG